MRHGSRVLRSASDSALSDVRAESEAARILGQATQAADWVGLDPEVLGVLGEHVARA